MKKARIFLSAILVVAILSGLTLPSLAVSKSTGITAINSTTETGSIPFEEIKNLFRKNNAETSEIASSAASEDESILNKICPAIEKLGLDVEIYSDFSDVTEESISNNKVSSLSSSSQSAQINRLLLDVTYYVYDSDDMEDALADPTVTIIDVMNNFTLDDSLEIPRDILIESGVEGAVTITSAALARHFYIDDQSSIFVTFNNVILSGNYVSGGIDITDSYVTIDGANIQNCYADNNWGGGAILAYNQTFVNNEFVSSGSLTITNGLFMSNVTTVSGGAIASFGPLSISDSTVDGNIAEESGGGVFIANFTASSITATLSNVTVDVNEATYFGGGICLLGITATVNNTSDITNNSALSGGGISSLASYTSISGSTIQGNMIASTEDEHDNILSIGGAGILSAGRLSLSNTTVSGNEANFNEGCGGGILAISTDFTNLDYTGTEEVTMVDCTINNNKGYYEVNGVPEDGLFAGGAIGALGLDVTVTGTTTTGMTISGNESATYGGGIYTIGNILDVTNCTISGNTASIYGGGIFTSSFMELIFDLDNYDIEAPDINISDGAISTNTAGGGGGVFMFGGDATQNQDLTYSYESHLYVDDEAVISSNNAGLGGGIFAGPSEIVIDGASQITGNNAYGSYLNDSIFTQWSGFGAGVCAAQSSLVLNDCKVSGNIATPDEGENCAGVGIYGFGQTSILVNDENTLITSNKIDLDTYSGLAGYGGGIYTEELSTLNITNGVISANEATYGAGVYSLDALTMSGGAISENISSSFGGGIFSTGTVTLTGGIVGQTDDVEPLYGNAASSGGGIYSTDTILISGGAVDGNAAYVSGGGIYSTGVTTITAGTVDENYVTNPVRTVNCYGGGIYSNGANSHLYINGGSISYNSSTAYGGGVYGHYVTFGAGGTGIVSYNEAAHPTLNKGEGGGLYIINGSLTMSSGEICYNYAKVTGGGVKLINSTIVYNAPASSSDIHDNTPNDVA